MRSNLCAAGVALAWRLSSQSHVRRPGMVPWRKGGEPF